MRFAAVLTHWQIFTPFMSKLYDDRQYTNLPRVFAVKSAEKLLEMHIWHCRERAGLSGDKSAVGLGDFLRTLPKCRSRQVEPIPLHIAPDPSYGPLPQRQKHQLATKQAKLRATRKLSVPSVAQSPRKRAVSESNALAHATHDLEEAERIKRRKNKRQ